MGTGVLAGPVAATLATIVAAGGSRAIPDVGPFELTSWILVVLAVAGLILRSRTGGGVLRAITPMEWCAAVLLAAAAASAVANGPAAVSGFLRIGQHVTILVAVATIAPAWSSIRLVLGGLLLGIGIQVAIGLVELARNATFLYSQWKPIEAAVWHGFTRIASTPADPNYFALGLVTTLPLIVKAGSIWPSVKAPLVWATAAAWLVAIAFSFSRAGYLALLLLPVIAAALSRSPAWRGRTTPTFPVPRLGQSAVTKPLLIAGAGLVLVAITVASVPLVAFVSRLGSITAATGDASLNVRLAAQAAAVLAFIEHPLVGLGADRFVAVGPAFLLDVSGIERTEINVLNSFLLVAAETGIVGFIAFVSATFFSLRAFVLARPHLAVEGPEGNRFASAAVAALAVGFSGWILISLTLDGIHSPLQWIYFGLGALVWRMTQPASLVPKET